MGWKSKEAQQAYNKAYYQKTREKQLARAKELRSNPVVREQRRQYAADLYANNRDSHRSARLKSKFGITLDEYRDMEEQQEACCKICGKHKSKNSVTKSGQVMELAVDHCHETGKVRGLLCTNCNRGLGRFKDNPEFLRNAADYLEQ